MAQDGLRHFAQQGEEAVLHGPAMIGQGTVVFAHAHAKHLGETALQRAFEFGVGFDAVEADGMIRRPYIAGIENRHVIIHGGDGFRRHGGPHRSATGGFRNTQVGQDRGLSLGGGAAMAAHGRHDEGMGSDVLQPLASCSNHRRQMGYAAAADGHRHCIAGTDGTVRQSPVDRRGRGGGNICDAVTFRSQLDMIKVRECEIRFDIGWVAHKKIGSPGM